MSLYNVEIKCGSAVDRVILRDVSWGDVLAYILDLDPDTELHTFQHAYIEISESYIKEK